MQPGEEYYNLGDTEARIYSSGIVWDFLVIFCLTLIFTAKLNVNVLSISKAERQKDRLGNARKLVLSDFYCFFFNF